MKDLIFLSWNFNFSKFLEIIPYLINLNLFLNKNWIYSDTVWCDFSNVIIGIHKTTEFWKYLKKLKKTSVYADRSELDLSDETQNLRFPCQSKVMIE